MKPTTTPGNASGKVSVASKKRRPKKRFLCKNIPLMPAITMVASVTVAESTTVETRLLK